MPREGRVPSLSRPQGFAHGRVTPPSPRHSAVELGRAKPVITLEISKPQVWNEYIECTESVVGRCRIENVEMDRRNIDLELQVRSTFRCPGLYTSKAGMCTRAVQPPAPYLAKSLC